MGIVKVLLQQDAEVLFGLAVFALVLLNQALKIALAAVRIGAMVSLAAAFLAFLPHIR